MLASRNSAIKTAETVVIVAHPDDEILWFASVLPRADNVILAFGAYRDVPGLGKARDAAVAGLPFPTTFLRLEEAGSYMTADWAAPQQNSFGLELKKAEPFVTEAYEKNFHALRDRLRKLLHAGQAVFSHNPWGEYGHEDHVLVFRVVEALRREIGFQHWVSAYVAERSALLASAWLGKLGQASASAAVDQNFAASIEAIYQKHGCWTWDKGWTWPKAEWFFQMSDDPEIQEAHPAPQLLNVIRTEKRTG